MSDVLSQKQLVEAIFELQWEIQRSPQGDSDPNYQLLVGRFYDRVQKDYPIYQQILPSFFPEDMIAGSVQHRFRKGENEFPIIQLGLGILTVNSNQDYDWDIFKNEVLRAIRIFHDCYINKSELKIRSFSLRYIDVVDVDFEENNIYEFLSQKLKINISLDESLFQNNQLDSIPVDIKLSFAFPCKQPKGLMIFNLGKAERNQKDAIVWDYVINSQKEHIPAFPSEAEEWLNQAHNVSRKWFFALVEGDLLESFR